MSVSSNSSHDLPLLWSGKGQLLYFTLHLLSHVWDAGEIAPRQNMTISNLTNKLGSIRLQKQSLKCFNIIINFSQKFGSVLHLIFTDAYNHAHYTLDNYP